jgi:putative membrane protein
VDRREYILATSAANTSNAFLALAALVALSRTRNGVMVALATQELPPIGVLLLAGVAAAILAYLLTILLSGISRWFGNIRVRTVSAAVILVIALLSLVLTGPFGVFILVLATLVGFTPPLVNIRRVACMGSIMLPIILFSFGVSI